jgi:hypothetical protein
MKAGEKGEWLRNELERTPERQWEVDRGEKINVDVRRKEIRSE